MGCDFPLKAYRSQEKHQVSGKRLLTFNPKHAVDSQTGSIDLPCGRCTGCRLMKAREWAVRCMHEAALYQDNAFITLTYHDDHLPIDYSVDLREFQLFMKRLRQEIAPARIRFFACGEYGGKTLRPHYHALIFNYSFPDKTPLIQTNQKQNQLFSSQLLDKTWPYGFNTIGQVNYQSAGYVARYSLKKVGEHSRAHADYYTRIHPLSGTAVTVRSEFLTMSRMPGLGTGWFDKYKSDCFPSDYLIVDGKHVPVPLYYLKKLDEEDQASIKKQRRREAAQTDREERSDARRYVKATVRDARIRPLQRNLGD